MLPRLRERFFQRQGQRYAVDAELRRAVIFGRHNLVQDSPISRVDVILCRNTLMYFNSETQARVLDHFEFALNDGGLLFLGRAEMLLSRHPTFSQWTWPSACSTGCRAPTQRGTAAARAAVPGRPRARRKPARRGAAQRPASPRSWSTPPGRWPSLQHRRAAAGPGPGDLGRPLAELPLGQHRWS